MEFKGITKKEEGKFITRYDIAYETVDNKEKIYEIISRNKNLDSLEALNGQKPDSVVIIVTDESGERLLVNREFRLAVGDWVYNFPAGLIDEGEEPQRVQNVSSGRRPVWSFMRLMISSDQATVRWALAMKSMCAWSERHVELSEKVLRLWRRSSRAGIQRKRCVSF